MYHWTRKDGEALTFAAPDAARQRELRREILRAIAECEKHSLAANVIGWVVCAAAASALPYRDALIAPLALRLLAIAFTRLSGLHVRRKLEAREPCETGVRLVIASLCFAGVTWSLMLWPIFAASELYFPALAIIGVTVIGVSLISAMLGAVPVSLTGFIGSFVATSSLGLLLAPEPVSLWISVTFMAMIVGAVMFSIGSARHQIAAAETLVENRLLGEELMEALAHAEFLSAHDPLTGLLNRRAIFDNGDRAALADRDCQVLVIDLDHFKRVNDRFGHDTGDRVLIATGRALRGMVGGLPGKDHRAIRLGGEEFALVLPGLNRAAALAVAEATRERIAAIPDELCIERLRVTASLGVASCSRGQPIEEALHRADSSMYKAKSRGRNRVIGEAA